MLLKRLEIRNCRKIRQADIEFHGPGLQVIMGTNQSGKSTLAQCIAMSMEGPKSSVTGMVSGGEEQAEIIAYTDNELKIRTVIRDTLKQTVAKKDDTSGRYVNISGGVRSFLDSMRSGLESPWALRELTDAQIIEKLKDRAGITQKLADIDAAIRAKEQARTDTGRDKRSLGELGDPVKEVKHPPAVDELKAERDAAGAYLKKLAEVLEKAAGYIKEKCVFSTIDDIREVKTAVDAAEKCAQDRIKDDKTYTRAGLDELERQYNEWLEIEKGALAFDEYSKKKKRFDELAVQYEALTGEISALRETRKKTLAGMRLGVPGLEIREDNLLYHNGFVRGITDTNRVGNWSTAESVKVFFTMGAAFSGEFKIMVVDNAESLDEKTTKVVSDWAETSDFLVILLKVANVPEDLEDGIIYIREGEVLKHE
jgi:DNA repair exonuclease SbcCD ATPase subunit